MKKENDDMLKAPQVAETDIEADDLENIEEEALNPFEEEARKAREASQKLKRRILIIAGGMVVFAVLAMILMPILDRAINRNAEEETTSRHNTVIYFDPDYEYDIMKDQEYLGLDRYIYYKDNLTGETILIEDKDIPGYGPGMVTLKAMLDAIIMGDHETYNSLFSTTYYETKEGRVPEPPFTMQQVYDILITKMNIKDIVDKNGKKYTQYEYTVEYKIHKNNGTFRTDLGHDDSRKQYFVLSDSTSTSVLIDQILGYNYVN
ncbi:MAG: hypothetical protein E7661_10520 [Ruminococcaceae bacterium]|nr:hypothetical protein [Oscillospiraceae bacterium]